MIRRRELLAAGGAAALAPASALAERATAAAAGRADVAVYDARFPAARAFARAQRARGVAALAARHDLAKLWYGPVRRALAAGRTVRLAGLTTYADFVVARGCAAEARLSVRHDTVRDGAATLVAWTIG